MSVLDGLNDEKLALIASAVRKWATAIDHAGLNPMMHVTVSELGALTNLMAAYPEERTMGNGGEQVDSSEG